MRFCKATSLRTMQRAHLSETLDVSTYFASVVHVCVIFHKRWSVSSVRIDLAWRGAIALQRPRAGSGSSVVLCLCITLLYCDSMFLVNPTL